MDLTDDELNWRLERLKKWKNDRRWIKMIERIKDFEDEKLGKDLKEWMINRISNDL